MCVVSFVGDAYKRHFDDQQYWYYPWRYSNPPPYVGPTKEDFDSLRAKVDEMVYMLKAARQYDAKAGQAGCEMADKIAFLRVVAGVVGVDLEKAAGLQEQPGEDPSAAGGN